MNPLTDLKITMQRPDGSTFEVIQPGARLVASKNWRLTEEAYRRYEDHIRSAMAAWPKESKFDIPTGMSPNTFCHRLRDAVQAIKLFPYDADVHAWMQQNRAEMMVAMDPSGTSVWIREKGQQGRPVQMLRGQSNERPGYIAATIHPNLDKFALEAFCVLGAKGLRDQPVQCRGKVSLEIQSNLMSRFDIAFAYDEKQDITTMV